MYDPQGAGHQHRGDVGSLGLALEYLHMTDVFEARQITGFLVDGCGGDGCDLAACSHLPGS